jgi:hypothetical protein
MQVEGKGWTQRDDSKKVRSSYSSIFLQSFVHLDPHAFRFVNRVFFISLVYIYHIYLVHIQIETSVSEYIQNKTKFTSICL